MTATNYADDSMKNCLIVASVIFGLIILFLIYSVFEIGATDVTDHFSSPLTVQQARDLHCPIPLPDSAKNIRFGIAGAFGSYEYLVRFEAPVEVCRNHVLTVFDGTSGPKPQLNPLMERPSPMSKPVTMFDAPWFDIENIAHGERAYWGDTIWIDDDRGVFYYQRMQ